ncbi:MAG: hypothetical protein AB1457_17945 [Chloroflexota bacterium]|uniref:Helix-turn-helix domain-containing protein n=1 Tax=Bellilinea caldifistulae TaxID=360411 RepID=A0A7C4Q1I2_9CHLR
MVTLPTLIPLSEAARKYGLEEAYLRQMVEKGKIRAAMVAGEMVVSEDEVRGEAIEVKALRKEDLPEYQMYSHLKGNSIWISEASRQYRVPHQTLVRWVKAGYIKQLGMEGNKVLIDEADIAYCSEIYRKRGRQGRILFNEDGTPYKPKTRSIAY